MDTISPLSADLIRELDEIYPVVKPMPGVNRELELYAAGQRSVVDRLLALQNEENERDYDNEKD